MSSRVVFVTGATGNLGRVVLERLMATGVRAVAVERTALRLGGETIVNIDANDAASVRAAFAQAARKLGRLDGVIHTAGIFKGGASLLDTDDDTLRALFETNVLVTAHVLRGALAVMTEARRGRIAIVASADAQAGAAGRSAYGASKSAQLRLVESAAAELKGTPVTINAVLPGTLDTRANREAQPSADYSGWVALDAVADVLTFLVSDAARAIHGQAIHVGAKP